MLLIFVFLYIYYTCIGFFWVFNFYIFLYNIFFYRLEVFEKNFSHIQPEKSNDDRKDLHNQNFHFKQVKIKL